LSSADSRNNFVTPLLSIFIFILLFQLIPSLVYGNHEINNDAVNYKNQFFVCSDSFYGFTCDPTRDELEMVKVSFDYDLVEKLSNSKIKFVDGKVGQGLNFLANKLESVEIENKYSINPSQFSISFWIKNQNNIEGLSHIISHLSKSLNSGWFVSSTTESDGKQFLNFGVTNREGEIIIPPKVELNSHSFSHVVGTFDGRTVEVYLDGKIASTIVYPGNYDSNPGNSLRIGSSSINPDQLTWSGTLDEVLFFNYALSDGEVEKIFNNQSVITKPKDQQMVKEILGEWRFENNLKDSSGKGNDGTMVTMLGSLAFAPDGRLFILEKNTGFVKIQKNGLILEKPFTRISDVHHDWEQGLLGITFDDDFKNNKFVYLYYTRADNDNGEIFNRVVRFTDKNNVGEDMKIIFDNIPATNGFHPGGAITIGPHDGKLYVAVGDGEESLFAQDPNIYLGKILRINKDGSIPQDNPFNNSPIFTLGHENLKGIAFDSKGLGFVTENGDISLDEINKIKKGGNYGFPNYQKSNISGQFSDTFDSIQPLRSYKNSIEPTQMIYYDGKKFPQLEGKFLFASYHNGIYILTLDEKTGKIVKEELLDIREDPFSRVIGITQSLDGEIFFGGYSIKKIKSIDFNNSTRVGFPISLQMDPKMSASNLKLETKKKEIIIEFERLENINHSEEGFIKLKIPKILLDGISLVLNEKNKPMNFSLRFDKNDTIDEFNNIIVNFDESNIPKKLIIKGTYMNLGLEFSKNSTKEPLTQSPLSLQNLEMISDQIGEKHQIIGNKTEPKITLLTQESKEGKNLILVEILNDSPLKSKQLKFAHQGQIKIINLVKQEGNVYKGLVHLTPPKNMIEVSVVDFNDNETILESEIKIIESKNILEIFLSWFQLFS